MQRNLNAGEMVVQAVDAARMARERGRPLTNLVMMGMGEPFHNYRETMTFIGILNDKRGLNFGARRITVSTSGIVPGIEKLAAEPIQVNLAISLHAPNDELRSSLVPSTTGSRSRCLAARGLHRPHTGRRISFEYALMKGINDSDEIAAELADLLQGMLCHVNIIPLNPSMSSPMNDEADDIDRFAAVSNRAVSPPRCATHAGSRLPRRAASSGRSFSRATCPEPGARSPEMVALEGVTVTSSGHGALDFSGLRTRLYAVKSCAISEHGDVPIGIFHRVLHRQRPLLFATRGHEDSAVPWHRARPVRSAHRAGSPNEW
ncbi:MAG: hypothetical protein R2848_02965 [Thermomicrobiales bacterium]